MLEAGELPNWKLIDQVSPDLIDSGIAVTDTLQAVLPSILAVDVDDEAMDHEKLKKMFRLAQLEIEYLLKTQEMLINERDKKEEELRNRKEQVKKLAETILSKKSSSGNAPTLYNCTSCKKVFLNESFLTDHMKRRHLTPL